jgi:pyridoxal phosphate enzyme (YggS family)
MDAIAANLERLRGRLAQAARRAGREPASVRLLAVTKTFGTAEVRAAVAAGQRLFGESYVQEAKAKLAALADLDVEWHFIGRLQTNKAKEVVSGFALIHSVDRLALAEALSRRAAGPVQILVQVNLAGEATKAGAAREEALGLIQAAAALPRLEVRGLMTLPPFFDAPERVRPFFRDLRLLAEEARRATGLSLPELSMGMSGDFEAAVEEGATLVRIGTAVFGERSSA